MESLYQQNGLMFWTEKEIRIRQMMVDHFVPCITQSLLGMNRAFNVQQIEAPILTPFGFINSNYTSEDYFTLGNPSLGEIILVLRPETTMGSYRFAIEALGHGRMKMPMCIWQHGLSFRREQDQPTKKMKLKQFYQLEFQIIYGLTTGKDYASQVIPDTLRMMQELIGPCREEDSDRLPSYSEGTTDIVCLKSDMEVCSISRRNDFPDAKVLEVAIGTDRCVYNFLNKD